MGLQWSNLVREDFRGRVPIISFRNRYTNPVSGENNLRVFPQLVRPEVAGILGTPLSGCAQRVITENAFILPRAWGRSPSDGDFSRRTARSTLEQLTP